jgi:N-formylmaleamate deformylase
MSTYLYGANVQANGIRQHYLRYGGSKPDRDAVIIVPGITSPAITWGFVGERFGQVFDTYVLDVRGRGLSEASGDLDYSLDAQAADLVAFAAALRLDRYAFVGHSMGARIAIRAARLKQESLKRIVLIDPPVSGPGRRAYPPKIDWYVDSMRLSRRGCDAEAMRSFCPTWSNEQLRLRAEWLQTCDERAVLASFSGFHTDNVHADMPHIRVPTLLMTAGNGDVIRPEDVAEIRGLLPGIETTRVEAAGHMIPWDDEEGFYRALGTFLGASLETPTTATGREA